MTRREGRATPRRARLYGLTAEEYNELLERHAGRCPICHRGFDLVIDHCHKTGRVRDLICRSCNTVVGHIERTGLIDAWGRERDTRCVDYIERWAAAHEAAVDAAVSRHPAGRNAPPNPGLRTRRGGRPIRDWTPS